MPAKQWEVRDMLIKLVERTLFHSPDTTFLLKHYIFPGHFGGREGKGNTKPRAGSQELLQKARPHSPGVARKQDLHVRARRLSEVGVVSAGLPDAPSLQACRP